jgi:hypothetical protein
LTPGLGRGLGLGPGLGLLGSGLEVERAPGLALGEGSPLLPPPAQRALQPEELQASPGQAPWGLQQVLQAAVLPQLWGVEQQQLEWQPQGWVRGWEQERGRRRALPGVPALALPSPQQVPRCADGQPD